MRRKPRPWLERHKLAALPRPTGPVIPPGDYVVYELDGDEEYVTTELDELVSYEAVS